MKTYKYWLPLVLMFFTVLTGCEKKTEPEEEQASQLTQKINGFIKEVMEDVYLWYDQLPDIDIKYEKNSEDYFYKLLYDEDKWSYITDDVTALEQSFEGVEKTYGYSLAFGRFVDGTGTATGNYFAIVEYVYPETPASRAGFARGDLIVGINGGNITKDNYTNLLSGTSVSVTKGILTEQGIANGTTLSMTAEVLNLDPVLMYKIIERDGHRIGYLIYLQYIASYNSTSLNEALQFFRDNQITELVLDLRYNPGGQTDAARYLASSLAPVSVVETTSTLVSFQWNDKYQSYWTVNNVQDQLGIKFNPAVPVKLDLNKVYILSGRGTASASELTICGLEPYMDVIIVGDTTYGKYTASITIKPEDWYDNASDYTGFKNWGMQPIILRFANSQGVTNFKKGFGPDYLVDDELLPAFPLGELSEPLLRKTVEVITGNTIPQPKSAKTYPEFRVYDRGFSRFDEQKRNLIIGSPALRQLKQR